MSNQPKNPSQQGQYDGSHGKPPQPPKDKDAAKQYWDTYNGSKK